MALHIGRTLPPAASPFRLKDILSGVAACFEGTGIVGRFEDELKSFFNVRHCFAVSSGKAALVLILQALHEIHPERDEVLIPAYTCYSVPSAIVRAGFKVRLCDMTPGTLDFDFDRIVSEFENPALLCVIPTHLFGMPSDVERVKSLVQDRDLYVVEDAAQAMGAEWDGRKLGTLGDAGIFSMGRGKPFSMVEGGIILTDNDMIGGVLGKRMAAIKGYGGFDSLKLILTAVALSVLISPRIYWLPKSLPFLKLGETHFDPVFPIRRLSAFQAGMAHAWKTKINKLKAARSANVHKITGYGLQALGLGKGAIPDLIRFPVLVKDQETKKELLRKSERAGLGISDGYPDAINGINEIRRQFDGRVFPVAQDLAERMVTLPVHPYVNENDLQNIAKLFN
ncbi:MAG: DegT/DnrJ/EryC1/StrS family aminotransferase [Geobacteraceae bacterium]|nr:DegT/DnrJ/EryC1/StrS family aminotransferase [Geobacteraceae bacterium]